MRMFTHIIPKLPMRNKEITRNFYLNRLGFEEVETQDFAGYLMVKKDQIEIHFFEYKEMNPLENDGQIYIRTDDIQHLYRFYLDNRIPVHPNGSLAVKPWGQQEFSILDPDHNLLTFGQKVF